MDPTQRIREYQQQQWMKKAQQDRCFNNNQHRLNLLTSCITSPSANSTMRVIMYNSTVR